jgi:hypothetical protein
MNKGLLKFKVKELVLLRDGINDRELELKSSLVNLAIAKKGINKILSEFPSSNKDGIIILPRDIFEKIKLNSNKLRIKFNWKKVALEIIRNGDSFISTADLYSKAKIKYPIELADKEKCIRGFSSALQYLLSEKKITRTMKNSKHLYGKNEI